MRNWFPPNPPPAAAPLRGLPPARGSDRRSAPCSGSVQVTANRGQRALLQDAGIGATVLARRIPYPPTRTPVLLSSPARLRVAALTGEFPLKPALLSVPRITESTVSSDKNRAEIGAGRIPYSPARTYRTVRQIPAPSDGFPVPRRKPCLQKPCKSRDFMLLGLGGGHTVLSDKLYRTRPQALPYSPTSFTVPSSKGYRTLRQALPYSAAKHGVPCDKSGARCACKTAKKRRRAVSALCSCFLLNVLMLFGEKD